MSALLRWLGVAYLVSVLGAQRGWYQSLVLPQEVLRLPDLPFGYEELEPFIEGTTLKVHHQGHHQGYCDKTNTALEEWRREEEGAGLSWSSLVDVLQHLSEVPDKWQTRLRNNGGGYLNHIFYWETMCHSPKGEEPSDELAEDIKETFGSFEEFKSEFSLAGSKLFGSGYVWLLENSEGKLTINSTHNQDCPLTSGLYPLLVMDVWEHAYYLQYQNKRSEYISAWWGVVCWNYVEDIRDFWKHHRESNNSPHQEL